MSQQSIERATRVLGLFTFEHPSWRVSDIAKTLDLAVGTTHGIVKALAKSDYLAQDPASKEYKLGLKLMELGSLQSATYELNRKSATPVTYLAQHTNTIGRVGVLYHNAILTTLSTDHQEWHPSSYIGPTVPAYCTGMGRAILSQLLMRELVEHLATVQLLPYTPKTLTDPVALHEEISATRERGYSLVFGETLIHLNTIGAPVFGAEGKVIGAISVSGTSDIIGPDTDITSFANRLMDVASEISVQMGYRAQPKFVDGT
ncbi:IclR family transcriptional regulator [Halodesulfovibrio sp.]|jgi:DNA-binding IclR family transcriptional regulator|uniref:IclR family transcriptional regulator n=1 Tax=Halodesulfovibrio sp. TaxID=1912772 RepID=UPI0025F5F3A9|nr:IclR family transcriptional regulator [Halodesulfovibrio sp.]MCT4535081.1 IclR family transcriptional regulator [Halodesulfovibrio sp.]MCT4627329.1 IclR family transcriptional regulator [Halodesulfovibrio sp.]